MGLTKGGGRLWRLLGAGDHVAILTCTPGPRTKDPDDMPAMPCCPCDSTTGLETKAPRGIDHGLTRAGSRCARCHNDGAADQIDDHEHFYLFQACECHKCDLFS